MFSEINKNIMNYLSNNLNFDSLLDQEIPSAYQIYMASNEAYMDQNFQLANKLERLNYLLHNSYISAKSKIGKNTLFAYGGIGIILHEGAMIGERCNIGSNVTIGGDRFGVPIIGHDVYIATGTKIIGNVTVGDGAIIGANSVLKCNVDTFCIVAGVPAKEKGKVTRENFYKYQGFYWCKNNPESAKIFCEWYFKKGMLL